MMTKSQQNKKEFIKPFKNMIREQGENSLVYIPKECITELQQLSKIKKLPTIENNWYEVNYECFAKLSLLEVAPDYYKVVSGGRIGQFLQHYKWSYDGKNVYNCSIIAGKSVRIERAILNYQKYGYLKNVNINDATHHMWFRFCALVETLKNVSTQDHIDNHREIGNYDRGQSIEILTTTDFDYFISVIDEITILLQNKTFSIEF